MLIRILAAAMFTAAGCFAGMTFSDKLRSQQKVCGALIYLLQRVKFLVCYRCDDIYEVCRNLRADDELKVFSFVGRLPDSYGHNCDFRNIWENEVRSENIPEKEMDILLQLGTVLGRSDRESQSAAIDQLITEAEALSVLRRENYIKKSGLYRSAGLLMGLMAGIIVI
ncbi:MAG: stage III sporulation protein AB [Ruminococcus sp.]|nr:stage III sporulation protein AB [Ruminococcus sp.]